MDREKLYLTTKLAYGSGDMGSAITANILVFFLLYFFTNIAGLPAGLSSMILAIGKVADAINDPIAGIMSDRTRSRWGRRLPWMLWGTIPFGIFFFLQWIVPEFSSNSDVNNWWLFIYYVAIGILFNLAYTAVNLPYTALTPELTQDYNERTSLNSFRFAFSIGGSILSLIIANLIFQTNSLNPQQQYLILGIVSSIISVIAIFWCTFRIQERGAKPFLNLQTQKIVGYGLVAIATASIVYGITQIFGQILIAVIALLIGLQSIGFGWTLIAAKTESHLSDSQAILDRTNAETEPIIPIKEQLKIAFTNKPFLYIIGIYLCSWLAVQLTASILIYFVVSWMGMSAAAFSTVAIAVQGTALIMLFFWQFVSQRIGKKAVYFFGSSIWIVAQAGLFLIQPGQVGLLYILAMMAGVGVSVAYLVPWSMIPDVIELDELNTGQRREGVFYSFMVLLQKFGLALALFLVGQALELAGFISSPPGGDVPVQPDSALLAIRIAVGPLPTIVLIIGLILAYFYPITKEIHDEIRLKLQAKKTNIS
jgi:GPH family glycoside/pentoside/hexuronide:cation symporter